VWGRCKGAVVRPNVISQFPADDYVRAMFGKSLLLAAALLPAPAFAQSIGDVVSGHLVSGWRLEGGSQMAAIRIELAPGWKTYWRAPGDAGIPPRFSWQGSQNLSGFAPHWPVPDVFVQNGLRSVGYDGVVTIPIELHPQDPTAPIGVEGKMEIGVCQDICIPATIVFSADLPPGPGADNPVIRAALADRPKSAREAGVGAVICRTEPISDGLRVTVSIEMPRMAGDEAAVVELSDPSVWVSEPAVSRSGGVLTAVSEMVPSEAAPFSMARQDLRITILAGGQAVDIQGCTGG